MNPHNTKSMGVWQSFLPHEKLISLIHYEPETGKFTWKSSPRSHVKVGDIAGCIETTGYIRIRISGKRYLAHRLAWFYVNGEWPTDQIDHINGEGTDNRIVNLRPVSSSENQQNLLRAHSHSKSGLLGTWPDKSRWGASIKINGKGIYLGSYETPEIAHGIYLAAKRHLHVANTL